MIFDLGTDRVTKAEKLSCHFTWLVNFRAFTLENCSKLEVSRSISENE